MCTFELLLPAALHEEGHAAQEVDLGDEPVLVNVEHLKEEPVVRRSSPVVPKGEVQISEPER
jgi:hypothetical protein